LRAIAKLKNALKKIGKAQRWKTRIASSILQELNKLVDHGYERKEY